MLKRLSSIKVGISPKLLAKNLAVLASAFAWYFLAYSFITGLEEQIWLASGHADVSGFLVSSEHLLIVGAGTAGIAVFAVFGSLLSKKFRNRGPFLTYWMLAGVFLSLIPMTFSTPSTGGLIALSVIFGGYFGLGMPTAMGFFASSTQPENRGRTGGIMFLAIGLSFFTLGTVGVDSAATASIVLAAIRLTGVLFFYLLKTEEKTNLEKSKFTYKEVVRNRSFVLYFIPWIMFNVVDYLTIPVTRNMFLEIFPVERAYELFQMSSIVESSLIAIFAVIAGFLIDANGRKRLAIFGFAFLGVGYASLGLFSPTTTDLTGWYFYTIADGIAWGILTVVFLFTLWGDLARGNNIEKFYVMAALPYLSSNLMHVLANDFMLDVRPNQVFTFASFFLFLAVLPLFFAPETLPEKVMKDRELKIYVEQAQEVAQKYY